VPDKNGADGRVYIQLIGTGHRIQFFPGLGGDKPGGFTDFLQGSQQIAFFPGQVSESMVGIRLDVQDGSKNQLGDFPADGLFGTEQRRRPVV
jgi:hypothetical protein